MILLHVITSDEKQAMEIADFLINEKLILDAVVFEKVTVRKKNDEGELMTISNTLMMGKTKALLFNYIDAKLRKKYKHNMPELYSLAIVNMDWEQSNLLISKTAKV